MHPFDYHRPASVSEAIAALRASEDGAVLAGGMTLIPTLKQRLASPSDVIDISAIVDLASISVDGNSLVIGALATHDSVVRSAEVQSAIPGLAELVAGIGDPQVRNRGTLGGSVANNDPSADYPAALMALGATVVTDRRAIAADDFFTAMFETALEADELITRVAFPIPEKSGYAKFSQPASRYALVGVMVAKTPMGARVAVTGAGPCVFRVAEMEAALSDDFTPAAIKGIQVPADDLNAGMHASAEYRAHLIGVMAKRAVSASR
jgi:carbon-monoxide dehydrogenase medium subunit